MLHAQHDSEVSRHETGKPPQPQTELSGTTPGNTGRAADSQRSGTLLLGREGERVLVNNILMSLIKVLKYFYMT